MVFQGFNFRRLFLVEITGRDSVTTAWRWRYIRMFRFAVLIVILRIRWQGRKRQLSQMTLYMTDHLASSRGDETEADRALLIVPVRMNLMLGLKMFKPLVPRTVRCAGTIAGHLATDPRSQIREQVSSVKLLAAAPNRGRTK